MLINDLMGGKFNSIIRPSNNNSNFDGGDFGGDDFDDDDFEENEDQTYSVYIQFDDDEPKELFQDIPYGDKIVFPINGPGPQSNYIFTDLSTGRKFRLFAK